MNIVYIAYLYLLARIESALKNTVWKRIIWFLFHLLLQTKTDITNGQSENTLFIAILWTTLTKDGLALLCQTKHVPDLSKSKENARDAALNEHTIVCKQLLIDHFH